MSGRYRAYPEYKDSGVEWLGRVPCDWVVTRIAYVFSKSNAGEVIDKTYWGNGCEVLYTCNRTPLASDFDSFPDVKRTEENDLLLTRNGTPYVHKPIVNAIYSNVVQRISLTEKYDRNYLAYCLGSAATNLKGYGVSIESLNFENWKTLSFAHPLKQDQVRIANFLDRETAKIDTLIEKQQQLIKLLKEKRQAVISHAVTKGLNPDAPMKDSDIEWLGEVPAHWEIKKFSHCARIRNGQIDPTKAPYMDYILIAPNHIESETGRVLFTESALEQGADSGKYLCKKGEVIYSKIRPALAKACLSPSDETICSADMYPISGIKGMTNQFLLWTLLSNWFTSLVILESDRVAMPKINREKLAEVRLPLPPEREQQEICSEIQKRLSKIDSLLSKADTSIRLANERRTALISAAVTGKIDVRNFNASK